MYGAYRQSIDCKLRLEEESDRPMNLEIPAIDEIIANEKNDDRNAHERHADTHTPLENPHKA